MANESSPLLRGSNGHTEPSNGSYQYHSHADASAHSISITTNGATNGARNNDERFYMGYDKRSLLNTPTCGLSSVEASRRLKAFGVNELEVDVLSLGRQLLRHGLRPTAMLVWAAAALEIVQLHFGNAMTLLVFQVAISAVAWLQQTKTTTALATVAGAVKSEAVVVRDGVHQTINASLLVPGDRLTLSAGAVVPADCELCDSSSSLRVDQTPLTGESFPLSLAATDSVKMGSTIIAGEGDAVVVATGQHTFLAKTANQSLHVPACNTAPFEKVAVRITLALLCVVLLVLAVCLATLLFHRERVLPALSTAITVLVITVPLSLPAVSRLVAATGSQRLLDEKIFLTRLDSVEKLASVDILCCDKTGTLTRNKLELQDDLPIFDPRASREDVLVSAALAAKWKEPPRDAVDTLVLNAIDLRPLDQYTLLHHDPFDPTSKRTESVVRGPTGRVFKVTKGAPESLLALAHNADDVRDAVEAKVMDLARRGISSLAVARTEESAGGNWVFLGVITYVDPPRHDSKRMIEMAHEHGVSVKLATGDQAAIAVETCRQLGMGMTVLGADALSHTESSHHRDHHVSSLGSILEAADGYAHVLPNHKVWIVDQLRYRGWTCSVTGDSVADVAAMKASHVGVAVDGACDAARRAADVVLAKPGLAIVVSAVLAARAIFQRMCSYVLFQILTTVHWALFVATATLLVRPGGCHFAHFVPYGGRCGELGGAVDDGSVPKDVESVNVFFQLPLVALVIVGLVQRLTSIALLHDKSVGSKQPQRWSSLRTLAVAVSTGGTAAIGSILLLFWALDSWNESGVLASYRVGSLSMDQVVSVVFLQLALASVFSVVVCRGDSTALHSSFPLISSSSPPTPMFVAVVVVNAALVTLVALFSPFADIQAISVKQTLFVWAYSVLWLFLQVAARTVVSALLRELLRLDVITGDAPAKRFRRVEAQRLNRIRLGLAFWSDDSTVRDSFVVGRAVRVPTEALTNRHVATADDVLLRTQHMQAEVATLRQELQLVKCSSKIPVE